MKNQTAKEKRFERCLIKGLLSFFVYVGLHAAGLTLLAACAGFLSAVWLVASVVLCVVMIDKPVIHYNLRD
jgi:hypothetical protein